MVDDIKNDRFELEDKSDQGYSSIEIPEPKTVEAAEEPTIEAAEEPANEASEETTEEAAEVPDVSNNDDDFDEKHDHKN